MFTFLGSALLIFALRMVGIAVDTMRLLMVMRGNKGKAWLFGFIQSCIYMIALGTVISQLGNWLVILGYATGFATGIVVGMMLEKRLVTGYTHFRIVSPARGIEIAQGLREAGFGVTEVAASGIEGAVEILHCSVLRKNERQAMAVIDRVDPEAFTTAENVRLVEHGFWS